MPRKKKKEITQSCERCSELFTYKQHGNTIRKYCSQKCFGEARTAERYTDKPCPECGKPRHTRKDREPTRCAGKCRGLAQSRYQKENKINPYIYETAESKKKRIAGLNTEKHKKAVSKVHKGVSRTSKKTKRNTKYHFKAIKGYLRGPDNKTYKFINLTKFVRDNKHLFTEESVKHKPYKDTSTYRCNAITGLSMVIRGHRDSWHGWMAETSTLRKKLQVKIKCIECGEKFETIKRFQGEKDMTRKYCSQKCVGKKASSGRTKLPRVKTCLNCGDSFQAEDKRGKRCMNQKYCSKSCSAKANTDMSRLSGVGVPAGLGHHAEKTWRLRSPRNITYEFNNLRHFIDDNKHLFDPDELEVKPSGRTVAYGGLCMLNPARKHPNATWKGWTWISYTEVFYNQGEDLLNRPQS